MSSKFNVLFWVRKSRQNAKGESPVIARISINGSRKDFNSGVNIHEKDWNDTKQRVKGRNELTTVKNESLDKIENQLRRIYNRLTDDSDFVTVYDVHASFVGTDNRSVTLLQLIHDHNQKYLKRLDTDRSKSTYDKYLVTTERIAEFLQKDKKIRDLPIRSITPPFIQDFQQFLLREHGNHHNTAVKHVKNFKRFMNYAVEGQLLSQNPFNVFKCGYVETEQTILTQAELEAIYRKKFSIERLEHTKNLFLLQCYTGLAYVDMAHLTHANLEKGVDGRWCLSLNRSKTKVPLRIPLLDRAYDVLSKLQPHHQPGGSQKLLPMITNQKMNAYLKEVADVCGITKKLSTHVGRRTMATTVLLSNGVPVEVISKILGHTKISTTQIYAKVKDQTVQKEIDRITALMKNPGKRKGG